MLLKPQALKYGSAILLVLVAILTVLNVCTPLRITTDSFRYLNIMEYLNGNLGMDSFAAVDFYPHGYPRLLQLLYSCHLLNSSVLVTINIVSVLSTAYIFTKLFEVKNRALFYVFVLLSFINIKHLTLPVADQLFTLVLFAGMLCIAKAFEKKYLYLIPALILAAIAIYIRTAGIVLFSGALFYFLYSRKNAIRKQRHYRSLLAVIVIVLVLAIITAFPFLEQKVNYLDQLALNELFTGPSSILTRLGYHFRELGEMMINIPLSQLQARIHSSAVDYLFIAAGLLALFTICRNIILSGLYRLFPFWVFLSYALMIFAWPFYDTRFLIPFIPFALYLLFPLFTCTSRAGYLRIGSVIIYIALGLIALGYSTMLSLDKGKFLKYYGNEPKLTKAYQLHFDKQDIGQRSSTHSDRDTMLRTIYLLDKFDK